MPLPLLILGSVVLVSLISFVGIGVFSLHERFMRKVMTGLISFAAGALIGDVFIHILPEMAEGDSGFFPIASVIIVVGLLLSFVLEKFIHWRHCHDDDCHTHPLGTVSLAGDAAHNFVDGILIASSFLVDIPTGIATTLAVMLHEIPQEIGNYALLIYSGYTRRRAMLMNFLVALTSLVGAGLVLLLQETLPNLERYLLPLIAGNFLYIAVADLLPELHKQSRISHSLLQLLGIICGVALMFSLTLLE